MSALALRPLQQEMIDALRESFRQGNQAVICYAPCGFGKTELAIHLMEATKDKGNKAAMVLDRIVLCNQTSDRLQKYNIDHGVLQSGHWRWRPYEKIQVCSAQTLEAMGSLPGMSLMIVDECHAQRKQTVEFIQKHPEIHVIGLSASPFTKGLGKTYSKVISTTTVKEQVDNGWLVPLRVFISKEIDMKGAKKVGGEWSGNEATERGIKITGDVVAEWIKKTHEIFGKPEKTIVFCAGVAHGEDLQKKFAEAGYNFVAISYKDDADYKKDVIDDFAKPDSQIHGLIATDILTKGFDNALCKIGVSARPFSKSFSSHVQQLGRVMRPAEGKEFSVWLDFSGNYLRFRNMWDDLYENGVSELDDGKEKPQKEPTEKEKKESKCPSCGALWPKNADICPCCGYVRPRRNEVIALPGEMVEIGEKGSKGKKKEYTSEQKEEFYHGLVGYLRSLGKNENRAYYLYKEKFGVFPTWKKEGIEPSQEVVRYVRMANIKYSKRVRL